MFRFSGDHKSPYTLEVEIPLVVVMCIFVKTLAVSNLLPAVERTEYGKAPTADNWPVSLCFMIERDISSLGIRISSLSSFHLSEDSLHI